LSADKARKLLNTLLDRVERLPDRRNAPTQRAPTEFPTAEARQSFAQVLVDAAKSGAISISMGQRETRHLIERVRLADAAKLYAFLARTPRVEQTEQAVADLRHFIEPRQDEAKRALDLVAAAWRRGGQLHGLSFHRIDQAVEFIKALDATLARDPLDRRDLRTYSGQSTGDTKLLERQSQRIVSYLKQFGLIDSALPDAEALAILGLEKFPQPVLIAGPVRLAEAVFDRLVYVGIPPEQTSLIEPVRPARAVLTIENLASFNRHVREARLPDDVVIYTGGFPSRAVISALTAIAKWPGVSRIYHWGDIDEGGLKIALHLAERLPIPVVPHLMTFDLARAKGTRALKIKSLHLPHGSPWASLAMFLEGDDSHFVEQEVVDPIPVDIREGSNR